MAWCPHCCSDRPVAAAEQLLTVNSPDGSRKRKRRRRRLFTSCCACGRVLSDRSLGSLDKALATIHDIASTALAFNSNAATALGDADIIIIIRDAQDLLRRASEKKELFARGRRTRTHLAASCLYVALRRHRRPYMLIDLSDHLKVNVYALGAVFVSLCRILRIRVGDFELEEEEEGLYYSNSSSPSSRCSVTDPTLFMHRISTSLLGRKDAKVAATASRILSRTSQEQRGWMLTTQKQIPVRICSAALYIAAVAHQDDCGGGGGGGGEGRKFSESEVARTVCNEFESMESGDGLTMDEFVSRAADMTGIDDEGGGELVCQHKKSGRPHCRYGLCKECCDVFVKLAGEGLEQHSAEAPAFQTARRNKIRCEQELAAMSEEKDCDDINVHLNDTREKQYKTVICESMNKEYHEEKSSASPTTGDKPRKERKQSRVGGNKGSEEMLPNESLSSRINDNVPTQLNGEEKQQQENETGTVGASNEQNNENSEGNFDVGALESDNEAEINGDGKSAAAEEGDDYYGDFEEDYGEGGYNEYYDEFENDDD